MMDINTKIDVVEQVLNELKSKPQWANEAAQLQEIRDRMLKAFPYESHSCDVELLPKLVPQNTTTAALNETDFVIQRFKPGPDSLSVHPDYTYLHEIQTPQLKKKAQVFYRHINDNEWAAHLPGIAEVLQAADVYIYCKKGAILKSEVKFLEAILPMMRGIRNTELPLIYAHFPFEGESPEGVEAIFAKNKDVLSALPGGLHASFLSDSVNLAERSDYQDCLSSIFHKTRKAWVDSLWELFIERVTDLKKKGISEIDRLQSDKEPREQYEQYKEKCNQFPTLFDEHQTDLTRACEDSIEQALAEYEEAYVKGNGKSTVYNAAMEGLENPQTKAEWDAFCLAKNIDVPTVHTDEIRRVMAALNNEAFGAIKTEVVDNLIEKLRERGFDVLPPAVWQEVQRIAKKYVQEINACEKPPGSPSVTDRSVRIFFLGSIGMTIGMSIIQGIVVIWIFVKTGAVTGSAAGPWGTVIGAGGGALVGIISALKMLKEQEDRAFRGYYTQELNNMIAFLHRNGSKQIKTAATEMSRILVDEMKAIYLHCKAILENESERYREVSKMTTSEIQDLLEQTQTLVNTLDTVLAEASESSDSNSDSNSEA